MSLESHPTRRAADPRALAIFIERASPAVGLDLGLYKPRQMERRLTALMARANVRTLEEFWRHLEQQPERLAALVDGLTINVSEFFRDPEKFATLAQVILPRLLDRFERLKIWSAGCSMGAELYTVGMLLESLGALERCELIGTDVDATILRRAAEGRYHPSEVRFVPAEFADYFQPEGKCVRFVSEAIKARSRFYSHNLLADAPVGECHLILCRNVVIYFNDDAKQRLYRDFYEALVPGGIQFVGRSERILDHRALGFSQVSPYFYQRPLG